MAGFKLRGWQVHSVGRLLVTVVVDPSSANRNLVQHRRLEDLTDTLIRRLTGHGVAATWGMCDPVQTAATAAVVTAGTSADVRHEIAVVGDRGWTGPEAGRPRFAKELLRRFEQARARSIAVSTLLYRDGGPLDHLDLVVKHGITAICRIDADAANRHEYVVPKALRYGVWELRCTGNLPAGPGWFAQRRLLRRIRRSADQGTAFHLVIDAAQLAAQSRSADDSLARLIQQLAILRDRGMLEIETMATVAAKLSEVPASKPQRSILRLAG